MNTDIIKSNNRSEKIIKLSIHSNAKSYLLEKAEEYGTLLVFESKLVASRQGFDKVQTNHVKEALSILNVRRKKNWIKEISKIIGGSLFGIFIPGFISGLGTNNSLTLIIYTAIGFSGMLLIFLGIIE